MIQLWIDFSCYRSLCAHLPSVMLANVLLLQAVEIPAQGLAPAVAQENANIVVQENAKVWEVAIKIYCGGNFNEFTI